MNLDELRRNSRLIDLFIELCEIPSPPLKEKELSDYILEIFKIHNINASCDKYYNIIAKIPASCGYNDVPPLLLSAHMDVVGGTEKVKVRLSSDEQYIETDKTRTLGADDKAGVAAIMDLAIELNNLGSEVCHGPIEITFTRDEEKGMSGIRNLDTSKLNAKYGLILDGEFLGELDVEGAGFTNLFLRVEGGKGGHSGINIGDKTRVNAIKVLSEVDSQIPQGVYKENERGIITSINAAVVAGGFATTYTAEAIKEAHLLGKNKKDLPEKYETKNLLNTISKESMLNVIPSEAEISYSIRSSDPENEKELIEKIKHLAKETNKKYDYQINVNVEVQHHLKPFVKSDDDTLVSVILESAKANNIKSKPLSFHAGAETHVLANEMKNAKGESFTPVIIGIANLENIHSSDEKIEWKSFIKGRKWLQDIVVNFAQKYKENA